MGRGFVLRRLSNVSTVPQGGGCPSGWGLCSHTDGPNTPLVVPGRDPPGVEPRLWALCRVSRRRGGEGSRGREQDQRGGMRLEQTPRGPVVGKVSHHCLDLVCPQH